MATGQMTTLVGGLRASALLSETRGRSDSELLGAFVSARDEGAFAGLVQRHGPMVLGVCSRILGRQDAEDAFQATFLVLVRKAASIIPRAMVGNWLYGVAYRTALEARRTAARRRAKETQVPDMPHPQAGPQETWQDVRAVLDEELNGLPDKLRLPIVLCDIEGRTRRQVACELRIPDGTLSNRLAAGRKMLAERLKRRGVALATGAVVSLFARNAAAASLSASLLATTLTAASCLASGKALIVRAQVTALMEGVLKAMILAQLKKVPAVVLVLALVACTCHGLAGGPVLPSPPTSRPQPQGREAAADLRLERPKGPRRLYRTTNFDVLAGDENTAKLLGDRAEVLRKQLARAWLGEEMPAWNERCQLRIEITPAATSDSFSTFTSERTGPVTMVLRGPLERLRDDELPLQLGHAIVYHDLGLAAPRWVGMGVGLQGRGEALGRAYVKLCRDLRAAQRLPPLSKLLPAREYPRDLEAFHSQCYLLTRFLVERRDPATFLAFVGLGMRTGWDTAVRRFYGLDGVQVLELAWLTWLADPRTQVANEQDVRLAVTRTLSIPVGVDPKRVDSFKEVRLFVSGDCGQTWKLAATIAPHEKKFDITVPADGLYWLSLEVVTLDGKIEPDQTPRRVDTKIRVRTGPANAWFGLFN